MSAIAGSAPSTAPAGNGSSRGSAQGANGEDSFSRMLQGDAGKATSTQGNPSSEPRPANGEAAQHQVEGKNRDASRQSDTKADTTDAAGNQATTADDTSAVSDTAATQSGDAGTDASTDASAASDGWPPPGLASLLDPAALAPAPARAPPTLPTVAGNDPATPRGGLPGNPASPAALALAARPAEPAALAASGNAEGGATALPSLDIASDAAPEPAPSALGFVLNSTPATGAAGTAATPSLTPSAPHASTPQLHGEGFADDIGSHVQWLAGQKISHAHIRISPQELGPVEVRLQLDGDRISADFSSAQPEVRQALESTLPRLREMLGQHGFELAHAGVGQQSRQDGGQAATQAGGSDDGEPTEEAAAPVVQRWTRRGLLDAYA